MGRGVVSAIYPCVKRYPSKISLRLPVGENASYKDVLYDYLVVGLYQGYCWLDLHKIFYNRIHGHSTFGLEKTNNFKWTGISNFFQCNEYLPISFFKVNYNTYEYDLWLTFCYKLFWAFAIKLKMNFSRAQHFLSNDLYVLLKIFTSKHW